MTIKGIKKPAKKRSKNQAISTPCTETDVKNHSTTRPGTIQETIAHRALDRNRAIAAAFALAIAKWRESARKVPEGDQ